MCQENRIRKVFEEKYKGRKDTMIAVELTTLPFKLKMSIGGRKAIPTSMDAVFCEQAQNALHISLEEVGRLVEVEPFFTALISERGCLSCREELILSKEKAVSPRMMIVHVLDLPEEGGERYRNVKLPILFDQAYLLQSPHPCGFHSNTKHVLP